MTPAEPVGRREHEDSPADQEDSPADQEDWAGDEDWAALAESLTDLGDDPPKAFSHPGDPTAGGTGRGGTGRGDAGRGGTGRGGAGRGGAGSSGRRAAGGQPPPSGDARLTAWVRGRVQGVGFRWWVRSVALELGLVGFAENLTDGRVKVVAEGDSQECAELLNRLGRPGTPGDVVHVTFRWDEVRGDLTGFAER